MINKKQLIKLVAKEANMTQKDTKLILNAMVKVIKNLLAQNYTITIMGFVSFRPVFVKDKEINSIFKKGIVPEHTRYKVRFTDGFIKQIEKEKYMW